MLGCQTTRWWSLPAAGRAPGGSGTALQAQANLAAQRADFSGAASPKVWPELSLPGFGEAGDPRPALWGQIAMAHSDCAACHHELLKKSWRAERGPGLHLLDGSWVAGVAGRPQLRSCFCPR